MEGKYSIKVSEFVNDQILEVRKRGIIDESRIKHYLNYRFRSLRDHFKSKEDGFIFYNSCLIELKGRL